jgi:hypothetical protein
VSPMKRIFIKKKNPTAGVWHHLFEPVNTGGLPIRALGDLGTPKGKAHTPRVRRTP